jgi:Tol biopolymer transport system component
MRMKVMIVIGVLLAGGSAGAMQFTDWSPSISLESVPGTDSAINTAFQDGCPAPSKDGLSLYMASNRPGGQGGLDIWVAHRESADDPFGPPVNLGPPINTAANEFCPTPLTNGHTLLFVSTKAGGCGGSDIYVTREHANKGWEVPAPLGCTVNSAGDEASPFFVEEENGGVLYFSSTRAGGFASDAPGALTGDSDIYVSPVWVDGSVGSPVLAPGVNSASQDSRPHVRRDALEIFFDSNRAGGLGGNDIWSATRERPSGAWWSPVNLGPNVNSAGDETRPYLSWGATVLYFGTTRAGVEGFGDIFFSHRLKVTGQ